MTKINDFSVKDLSTSIYTLTKADILSQLKEEGKLESMTKEETLKVVDRIGDILNNSIPWTEYVQTAIWDLFDNSK